MNIQDKALLVKLSFSLPGNSRTDAKITADTILAHAMTGKAGRWLKQIFPDEAIEPLTKFTGAVRTWNDEHTLPWSDDGYRILPTAAHSDYTDHMRAVRQEFEAVKSSFLNRLPEWEAWARVAHNGTFDESLYDYAKLQSKFAFKLDFSPIPCGSDFRCTISDEDRAAVDSRVSQATADAQTDLWHRLAEPLAKLAAKLNEERDNGKAPIFRDTLISNIKDIAALVPALNVTSDPQLSLFATEAAALATTTTPDTLRVNATERKQTADKAKAILDRMSGYFTTTQS